jgi:PST family polysaccharide transporter
MSLIASGRNLIRHRLAKNTAALFIVQISTYAAPMLVLPYLSRVLSKDHWGLIAFATSFNWYFMSLVDYGFNLTATRRIAIHRDDPAEISRIFSSVMAAKVFLTVLGFALMLTVVLSTPKLRPNLGLFCICFMLVVGDLLFPLWLFQGLEKMANLVWRDLGAKMLSMALIFAFVHQDGDYLWAAAFQSGSMVLAGIVGLWAVFASTPVKCVIPKLREVITALVEGWPVFLSIAANTLTTSTDIVILGFRSGPTDVAYYTNAYRLIVALRALVSPVVTALYPHISHMAFNSRDNAIAFLRKYALILAAPFFCGGLVLLVGASPIVKLLFSAKYLPTVPLLRILAFSPFLLALQTSYATFYMLGFGYEKEWSRIVLQTAVLNFVLLIPLIWLMWPPAAVSITGILLDTFVTIATYLFFRKSSARIPQTVAA